MSSAVTPRSDSLNVDDRATEPACRVGLQSRLWKLGTSPTTESHPFPPSPPPDRPKFRSFFPLSARTFRVAPNCQFFQCNKTTRNIGLSYNWCFTILKQGKAKIELGFCARWKGVGVRRQPTLTTCEAVACSHTQNASKSCRLG